MGSKAFPNHSLRNKEVRSGQEAQATAKLAAIVESSEDAIISKSLKGIVETWNRGAEQIFGYTAEEMVGQSIRKLIPAERFDEENVFLERLSRGERVTHFETVRVCKNGSRVDVSVTLSPIRDSVGRVMGVSKIVRDITLRKQAQAVQERQAEFDRLITKILARFAAFTGPAIDDQIQMSLEEVGKYVGAESAFIILSSRNMETWSRAYEANAAGAPGLMKSYQDVRFGQWSWAEQRLLGGEAVQIATLDDFPREAAFEREIYEREGVKSALLLPLRGLGGQVTGCVGLRTYTERLVWSQDDVRRLGIFSDALANVLERKRVENDLYASRQMLQQILDTIPQRVFWKDLDLNYLGCNKPFATDAGFPDPNFVKGKTDHDLPWSGENAERFRADDRRVIERGVEQLGYEEPQLRLDGKVAWVRTSKIPLRDHEGRIFGVLGTYEDITALRQTRDALKQAKESAEAANQAKDQFIAILSHELRTPLTPVLALVSAVEEMDDLPSGIRSDMGVIHRNVELEARLIDDLLDVTRIAQGKITLRQEAVDAHACVRSALAIFESEIEAKHLKVSLQLHAREFFVWADPARLRQVFWNLLSNAIKFTPEHGRIEVKTYSQGSRFKAEVADTGIGIEPEAMGRIFNAFEQGELTRARRFGGLGLGLSIAKALVEMHEGKLVAFSEGKNKGSVFSAEMATIEPPVPKAPMPTDAAGPSLIEPQRILLVEDHEDTLRILARLLRKWGYGVTTADCVRKALERVTEQRFDLLISDLGLPDGSGIDVMRELKERYNIPAIALSGYGTDEDIRTSLDAGFTEHLTKPISVDALRKALERLAGMRE